MLAKITELTIAFLVICLVLVAIGVAAFGAVVGLVWMMTHLPGWVTGVVAVGLIAILLTYQYYKDVMK